MVRILKLARSFRRGVDLWANVPLTINAGIAKETLDYFEELDPSDVNYNEEEEKDAEAVLAYL